jgi:hypothetical protein
MFALGNDFTSFFQELPPCWISTARTSQNFTQGIVTNVGASSAVFVR